MKIGVGVKKTKYFQCAADSAGTFCQGRDCTRRAAEREITLADFVRSRSVGSRAVEQPAV